jgi:hypothetical protein
MKEKISRRKTLKKKVVARTKTATKITKKPTNWFDYYKLNYNIFD